MNWNAVTYALEPVNTVVPYTGGTITYDALLFSELNQPFQNVVYKTFVTTPLGDVIGPTFQRSFTLGPQAYIHIPEVPVQVPANALLGNYFFHGRLYCQGAPVMEQTFQFDKMGGGGGVKPGSEPQPVSLVPEMRFEQVGPSRASASRWRRFSFGAQP